MPLGALLILLLLARCTAASERTLLVVGSVNLDLTVALKRLPARGETVTAVSPAFQRALGGKGANQAFACARLGFATRFVGVFGSDEGGQWLYEQLASAGVQLSLSHNDTRLASGTGLVLLEPSGSATAVVLGGANAGGWRTDEELRVDAAAAVADGTVSAVLLQREVPERVNIVYAAAARAAGVPVHLDAGGEDSAPSPVLLAAVDYLSPNESELERLTGLSTGTDSEALAAAERLLTASPGLAVLATLGPRGALLLRRSSEATWVEPVPLLDGVLVDATAAGDSFRAAFAVALAEHQPLAAALRYASAAGAVAASRAGAAPSLPTRADVDSLLAKHPPGEAMARPVGCSSAPEDAALRFGARLNSMRARRDLAGDSPDSVLGWIKRQGRVAGLTGVYLNHPQHTAGATAEELGVALQSAKLTTLGITLRFPDEYRLGAFSNPDAALRKQALVLAQAGCSWAQRLNASELIYWSAFDGYDYAMSVSYDAAWAHLVESFRHLADACPLKVSIEWKPSDPASRYSFVSSTASALLLAADVARANFGLTLDVGHMLLAGENPAAALAMAASRGKLFSLQLGDVHDRPGAEDGLAFGSVHAAAALELVHVARRVGYSGAWYFDTFPSNEDPVREAEFNIRSVRRLWERSRRLSDAGVDALAAAHDSMGVLELLERMS